MSTIYILKGWACYESDELIAAYAVQGDADAEAARLNALRLLAPIAPVEFSVSDQEWNQYYAAFDEWAGKFPRKDLAAFDGFGVDEVVLVAAGTCAENKRLRDIIHRALTKFCEDGPDGVIAAAMFTILGEVSKPNA